MKKILQLSTLILVFSFSTVRINAQVVTGDISGDWTLTDITGHSYHLDSILNAGKTVFIDISATWCAPCWNYHNHGAFDSLWSMHGPLGATGVNTGTTNDCMVFFVEGDAATNTACLHGSTGCVDANHNNSSQGDWTAGTNYPIIDPTATTTPTCNAFDALYNLGYFPTCVMICPDRSMTEVDQYTAVALYAAKTVCTPATVAVDAEMITSDAFNQSLATCDSVTTKFRLGNVGTDTLTSATITVAVDGAAQKTINWTGSLATYGSTTITGIKLGSATAGAHTVTTTISNPNGVADPNSSNNVTTAAFTKYGTVGGPYVVESFETSGIPTDWLIIPGGSTTWFATNTVGYSSSTSAILNFYSIPNGQIDLMKLPPMSFASTTTASLTFDVAYAQYSASNTDRLQVDVSTNCGVTWTNKYNKAGTALKTVPPYSTGNYIPSSDADWRHESVNLNSIAGQQQVIVRFKGTSNYGNNLFVDNINFSNADVSGIDENLMEKSVNVYPNPLTNVATVDFSLTEANDVSITLVNTIGELVLGKNIGRMPAGTQNYSLDATSLSNGFYFLTIKIGENTVTKKVAVNK